MIGARIPVRKWSSRKISAGLAIAGCLALGGCVTPPPSVEHHAEANYLFHFTEFVEWPKASLPDPQAPLVIGILGGNPFGDQLSQAGAAHRVNGHPIVIRRLTPLSDLKTCQIVFINRSVAFRLPLILYSLSGGHTLTVSDAPGFASAGGMIQFFVEDGKVRFGINRQAVDNAGLKMNSQLLILAKHPPGRRGN